MKKIILVIVLMMLVSNIASAVDFEIEFDTINTYKSSSSFSNIQVTSLKYEPYPANPGEYMTVWIKAENVGSELTEDAVFELVPEYPFSLDSNEDPIREYGTLPVEEPVVMEYKVRVDKDAVDSTNELKLRYKTDASDADWIYKKFDIEVDDAQTDFDLVVQEVADSDVSIAIANTGENVAYSVIVRIPEQEGYQVSGTNGQMVGNLENGDYTLVGFDISKYRGASDELKVQIDYTDEIGERRSSIKNVFFSSESNGNFTRSMPEGMTREDFFAQRGGMMQQETSLYQKWWFWTIIIAVLYAAWKGFHIYKKKKEEKEEKKHKK